MADIINILAVLEKKKELFEKYEDETASMLTCEADGWEKCMQERENLRHLIDKADTEVAKLLEGDPDEEKIMAVIKNRCDAGGLPTSLGKIFTVSQKIFSVINRIQNNEPEIMLRIEGEKIDLLDKIKKSNTSNDAQVSKYINNMYHIPAANGMDPAFGKA